jgi:GNAT superfamily N-acetyltransferase
LYIVDAPISKPYWEPTFREIVKLLPKSETLTTCIKRIDRTPYQRYYVLTDRRGDVKGWMFLTQRPGWAAWEVAQSFMFDEWRGQGLGKRLYTAVLIHARLLLSSGTQQSKSSRGMWRWLAQQRDFSVWAQDFNDLDKAEPVVFSDGELWSPLQIYVSDAEEVQQDVRLLALWKPK